MDQSPDRARIKVPVHSKRTECPQSPIRSTQTGLNRQSQNKPKTRNIQMRRQTDNQKAQTAAHASLPITTMSKNKCGLPKCPRKALRHLGITTGRARQAPPTPFMEGNKNTDYKSLHSAIQGPKSGSTVKILTFLPRRQNSRAAA